MKLDNAGAVEIINSLGEIHLDFSHSGFGTMYEVYISPQSRVRSLNFSGSPFNTLMMWINIPQTLCHLDFSNMILPSNNHELFSHLAQVFASHQNPLSLRSVNLSYSIADPQSVVKLLEVILLSPMIRLNELDISGCKLGDLSLHCLGHCLRKNRTLTTLRFDCQGATVAGYVAFRGCLYGNKKLIDVPYPYIDATQFFTLAQKKIPELEREISSYKPKISSAYRSGRRDLMQQHINSKVAAIVQRKEWERAIGQCASVLREIFDSVEQNRTEAAKMKQDKLLLKRQSTKVVEAKRNIGVKESKLLYQLTRALEKHRSSISTGKKSLVISIF
jgi:hypothetical protein